MKIMLTIVNKYMPHTWFPFWYWTGGAQLTALQPIWTENNKKLCHIIATLNQNKRRIQSTRKILRGGCYQNNMASCVFYIGSNKEIYIYCSQIFQRLLWQEMNTTWKCCLHKNERLESSLLPIGHLKQMIKWMFTDKNCKGFSQIQTS